MIKELDFLQILRIYCGEKATALELKEEKIYRGCKIWSFKRRIKKWRPTTIGLNLYRKGDFEYKDMPEEYKESYIQEYWMALTNYEIETEDPIDTFVMDNEREFSVNRLQGLIDKQYIENMSMEDVM